MSSAPLRFGGGKPSAGLSDRFRMLEQFGGKKKVTALGHTPAIAALIRPTVKLPQAVKSKANLEKGGKAARKAQAEKAVNAGRDAKAAAKRGVGGKGAKPAAAGAVKKDAGKQKGRDGKDGGAKKAGGASKDGAKKDGAKKEAAKKAKEAPAKAEDLDSELDKYKLVGRQTQANIFLRCCIFLRSCALNLFLVTGRIRCPNVTLLRTWLSFFLRRVARWPNVARL